MARPKSTGNTKLYRYFSAGGDLLYVGVSLSALIRLYQRRRAPWVDDVAHIDIEAHASRDAAMRAEAEAIRQEKPKHNVTHNNRRPIRERDGMSRACAALAAAASARGDVGDARFWEVCKVAAQRGEFP
jgi:hypothetical protein